MQRFKAVSLKLIIFLGFLNVGFGSLQADAEKNCQPTLLYRINYDSMIKSIIVRLQRFENQKYVQAGLVASSVLGLILAWKYWPQDEDSIDSSASGSAPTPTKSKKEKGVLKQLWNHGTKNFGMVFISIFAAALAQQLGTDVFGGGKKLLRKVWFGTNNCCFYESLAMVALNSYDGLLLRRKEGVDLADADVVARYNLCIKAFERYVTEIAADTLYLTRKHGLSQDALNVLLVQFVDDVDDVNSKILTLDAKLPAKDARGKNIFNAVMETLGQIKELHARLTLGFDQKIVGNNNVESYV